MGELEAVEVVCGCQEREDFTHMRQRPGRIKQTAHVLSRHIAMEVNGRKHLFNGFGNNERLCGWLSRFGSVHLLIAGIKIAVYSIFNNSLKKLNKCSAPY